MRVALSLLLAAALAIPTPALAGNNGKGKKAHGAPRVEAQTNQAVVTLITVTEQSIILGYVSQHSGSLPVGLATAKPLPPGIAKKLARGGSLPPGIAKRYLPGELQAQLPPRPGYEWVVVGTDVVLIAVATGLIVDIIWDAL
jgi:Nickel/cobalt transporter regulator